MRPSLCLSVTAVYLIERLFGRGLRGQPSEERLDPLSGPLPAASAGTVRSVQPTEERVQRGRRNRVVPEEGGQQRQ